MDLISRQDAIDALERTGEWLKILKHHKDREQEYDYYEITCSECGGKPEKSWHLSRYCPNCGARMVSE